MSAEDAEKFFQYTMEGQLRSENESLRKLNIQLSKALVDALNRTKRIEKELNAMKAAEGQKKLDV
jgi:hypothetical protein